MGHWDDIYDEYEDACWNCFGAGCHICDDSFDAEEEADWARDNSVVSSGFQVQSVGENNMGVAQVGGQFTTGNSTVAQLPVGSILEVVGKGQLEIVEVPVREFYKGDRIDTHHGPATVVAVSSRIGSVEGFNAETEVLYVADADPVVRRILKSKLA